MAAITVPARAQPDYINTDYSWRSWLLTVDHKRIAILYLISVTFFFFIGGFFATLVRLELMTPPGDLFAAETYNKMFTMHGVFMVFLFLIPAVPAVLGNFLVPLMIGARDLAFPRLNLLSWYLFMLGGLLIVASAVSGGVDTGWTFYPPYSTSYAHSQVMLAGLGVFVTGFSSILTGLNFIVTIHTMRAPGLTWFRLPLFIWANYATSLIMLLGTPVIAVTIVLLALERVFRIGIFDPALGGDPVLFQHLFWFYSHPAVYIMILPGMGIISEVIPCFARRRIFGYRFIAFSSFAIATIGFPAWGHHLFVSGQSIYASMAFSAITYLVAIPSAIKTFNWTATLYQASISYRTPLWYALWFMGLFVIGGLTGLFVAALPLDVHVHDTYFVVAHFHYIMVGGQVMAYLAGIHYWWPKMTGRMYPEGLAKFAAFTIFIGFNLTFFPQFIVGYIGMPRRYYAYPPEYQVLNVMSTAGASVLAFGYLLPMVYLIWSLRYGPKAEPNPWEATGLEWQTSSPPSPHNFAETPVVTQGPYAYSPQDPHEYYPQGVVRG